MTNRYALIRYRAPSGTRCVGSGLLVRDRTVLTADHVADGSEHSVECDGGRFPVEGIVRSGTVEVDLAILILSDSAPDPAPTPSVTQMCFARVDRSRPVKVTQCVAVGFPRWGMDKKGRASAQVEGYVRTGEGLHMLADGADGEWLTLVGNRIPKVPNGSLAPQPDSPWGGMSGAVVVCHDMVIGVIRSHNLAKGPESLTVTPLTALKRLPARIRGEFCAGLGLGEIDKLPVITGDDAVIYPPSRSAHSLSCSEPAFSAEVRDRYRDAIAQAGLEVPDHWGETELAKLRCSYHGHDATADLLEALCIALGALPVLEQIGGHEIGIRKLGHLYRRHVGRWPDSASREGMLILAASAGIFERRHAAFDANYEPEPLTALARFMLGIAGHWKAVGHGRAPGTATLDDARLRGLADWLTDSLGQQRDDAADYLDVMVDGRTWALIELSAADSAERAWPDAIVVDTVSEQGAGQPHREPCTARSEEGVLTALRDVVNNHLPEGDVFVDLFMPRHLLDAGVEHWDVVQVGGRYESIAGTTSRACAGPCTAMTASFALVLSSGSTAWTGWLIRRRSRRLSQVIRRVSRTGLNRENSRGRGTPRTSLAVRRAEGTTIRSVPCSGRATVSLSGSARRRQRASCTTP